MPRHELHALLDCPEPECGETFLGEWVVELIDLQQLDEPPAAHQVCPACRHVMQSVEYPGWTFFGEAG